jgi:polyhydroxyalkanoate synthesis repressor PhaR
MARRWKSGTGDKVLIKKYGNRRLYDTYHSRYVTLSEVAALIRGGSDVRVIDAKSNEDLTKATLMQILLDGRGAAQLLPAELLTELVRMEDAALGEFLGRYTAFALELYLQVKHGGRAVAPWNPLATVPMAANDGPTEESADSGPEPQPEPLAAMGATADEVAEIRRELAELKVTLAELAAAAKK